MILLIMFTLIVMPALIACVTALMGYFAKSELVRVLGERSQVIVGGVGVIMHELGHLIVAVIFRHKITSFRLLQFKDLTHSPTIGYVNYLWQPLSLYQNVGNYFIGIAPFYSCLSLLWLAHRLLIGKMKYVPSAGLDWETLLNANIQNIVSNFGNDLSHPLGTLAFGVIVVMVATTGFALSLTDESDTVKGLIPFTVFLVPWAIVTALINMFFNFNLAMHLEDLIGGMIYLAVVAMVYLALSTVVISILGRILHGRGQPIGYIKHPYIRKVFSRIVTLIR